MLSETLVLLLMCIAGVRSWQDSIKTADEHSVENTGCLEHSDENTECLIEKPVEKYNDGVEATCEKSTVIGEEGECSASDGATHDETDCGMLVDEEDDQSALLMYGQEDQEVSTEDNGNNAPDECPQPTAEKDMCESVDSSQNLPKEGHHEEFPSESDDVRSDSLVVQDTQSDLTDEKEEKDVHKSNADLPGTDKVTNKEPDKGLEPENLREILLKLKVSIIAVGQILHKT